MVPTGLMNKSGSIGEKGSKKGPLLLRTSKSADAMHGATHQGLELRALQARHASGAQAITRHQVHHPHVPRQLADEPC